MNDLNTTLERIIALYDSGGDPKNVMQSMMQQNSHMSQMQTQLQNMSQGRNPREFLLQLARQNGVSEKNLQGLSRILGGKL